MAVLAAALLYPALTPAHVEGFSASIVSLGLHIAQGDVAAYDRLYPVNLEFFGLSRLGTSLAVASLARGLGLGGEAAMRVVMWLGLVGLAVASWSLVRRWAGASGPLAAAALLILPGVAESAFFYNDNVLSSALAVSGLAVLAASRRPAPAVLAGVLLGAGIVTRADAVLLGLAVPLILLERRTGLGRAEAGSFAPRTLDWRTLAVRPLVLDGLLVALGALLPIVGLLGAFHATFLDVLHISRYAVGLWAKGPNLRIHATEVLYFLGLPGAVLAVLGVYRLAARREYLRLLLLAGVPLAFNLVSLGTLWQARQLLPLTPFVAALAVWGWRQLAPESGRFWGAVARPAVIALTAVVFFAPTRWLVRVDDGPRALRGRLWSGARWTRWQRAVAADMDGIRQAVASAGGAATTAIVTDSWNADRYVHLALQERGYTAAPAARIAPACGRTAELFQNGRRRVLHVRLHVPFFSAVRGAPLIPARLASYGVPCLTAAGLETALLVEPTGVETGALAGALPPNWSAVRARADSIYRAAEYDVHAAVPLGLGALRAYAERVSRPAPDAPAGPPAGAAALTLAESERLLRPQVQFGR